ncbi:hypothetical protein CKAH01_06903 [Colletotrichum kahawae]|uniref:Uncharacterized protein n=1 Tax=Colletotrichum kahawae TaxID=34407 RepID=A0AAE0D377_COLKA|nr:hypothetical protein CKAH01_06903 [Colletotrichum kahawae]
MTRSRNTSEVSTPLNKRLHKEMNGKTEKMGSASTAASTATNRQQSPERFYTRQKFTCEETKPMGAVPVAV